MKLWTFLIEENIVSLIVVRLVKLEVFLSSAVDVLSRDMNGLTASRHTSRTRLLNE